MYPALVILFSFSGVAHFCIISLFDKMQARSNGNCQSHCRHCQLKKANTNPVITKGKKNFGVWGMSANLVLCETLFDTLL